VDQEKQWLARAREGSPEAFTALVRIYRERLFRFLIVRCGNRDDAEDVLQESLVNAYRYIHTYDDRWRFSTWLYRIALRKASLMSREASVPLDESQLSSMKTPLDEVIAASERANLWAVAKKTLGDEIYTALWLRTVEDASMREIAETLGRSVSWTKVSLHRARRALDAELSKMEVESHG